MQKKIYRRMKLPSRTYRLIASKPSLAEYQHLQASIGQVMSSQQAHLALERALYWVIAYHDKHIVGMGCITEDGAGFFYLQDIIVHPEHRYLGLGKRITGHLLKQLKYLSKDINFIGLFAGKDRRNFLEQFGLQF